MDSDKPPVQRTQRLFLALWPDDDVRRQLTAHTGEWTWPSGCVKSPPEDWHLTLHFIGNVGHDQMATLPAVATVNFHPFTLVLDHAQLWSKGVAVLCPGTVPAALQALRDRLGERLRELDLPVEQRPYRPHITLSRRASAAVAPTTAPAVMWRARDYVLAASTGASSPRYQLIQRYE